MEYTSRLFSLPNLATTNYPPTHTHTQDPQPNKKKRKKTSSLQEKKTRELEQTKPTRMSRIKPNDTRASYLCTWSKPPPVCCCKLQQLRTTVSWKQKLSSDWKKKKSHQKKEQNTHYPNTPTTPPVLNDDRERRRGLQEQILTRAALLSGMQTLNLANLPKLSAFLRCWTVFSVKSPRLWALVWPSNSPLFKPQFECIH